MLVLDITEARERLSELVDMVANGQPFMIAEKGELLVKVSAYQPEEDGQTAPAVILG